MFAVYWFMRIGLDGERGFTLTLTPILAQP